MNITTTIHVKTDVKTRNEAKKVAEDHGLSLTALINVVLKQIARTKHLTLSLEEEPNEYFKKELKQALKDREEGKASPIFKSADEAIKWLEQQGI